MPNPGPMPSPNPPPIPTTSNRIINSSTAWTIAEMPTKARVRPACGRVVESRTGSWDMKREATQGLTGGVSYGQGRRPRARALPAEACSQRASLRSADGHLAAGVVAHDEFVASAEPGDDFLHVMEVHEARLVDAEEHLGIEPLLQLAKRVVCHEGPLARVGVDQAVLHAEPAHVVDGQQQDAPAAGAGYRGGEGLPALFRTPHHGLDVQPRASLREARAPPPNRLLDPRPAERLEQIVDRLHLEGADGIFVEGGRE